MTLFLLINKKVNKQQSCTAPGHMSWVSAHPYFRDRPLRGLTAVCHESVSTNIRSDSERKPYELYVVGRSIHTFYSRGKIVFLHSVSCLCPKPCYFRDSYGKKKKKREEKKEDIYVTFFLLYAWTKSRPIPGLTLSIRHWVFTI